MNIRRALLCALAAVISSTTLLAQGVLLHEDFESGASAWTFGGLCHLESDTSFCGAQLAPYPSPGHCVWFGSQTVGAAPCNYTLTPVTGSRLELSTPLLLPPTLSTIALRYRRFLATEGCSVDPVFGSFDVAVVSVTTQTGPPALVQGSDCDFEPGWSDRRVDISGLSGSSVIVGFDFSTGDQMFNGTLGWWVDDVEVVIEPGTVSCVAFICPCQYQSLSHVTENSGGCLHSESKEARLFGNGVASLTADSVELVVHDLPLRTSVMYVQGSVHTAAPFGDGMQCLGGPMVRLGVHQVVGGADSYPHPGEPTIASLGSISPVGDTRAYQVVYRNAASFCTSSTFNTSNAYVIGWQP